MELSEEQLMQPHDYSIGSIHAQLVHTMSAEWLWLSRIKGTSPSAFPSAEQYPTREAIRARWDEIEADWRAYLDALTDDKLTEITDYNNLSGKPQRTLLAEILMHVANHGTDHRAQTLALLHRVGGRTFEQDVIFYVREKPTL